MKKLIIFLLALPLIAFDQDSLVTDTLGVVEEEVIEEEDGEREVCKVGVYVTSIYDLSLSDRAFSAEFWIWYNYSDTTIRMVETSEITNAKDYSFSLSYTEFPESGGVWAGQKCRAVLKKEWDTRHFPFDTQELVIEIEEGDMDASELEFVADVENSKYDERIKIDGWKITKFNIESKESVYKTTYGDPELTGESIYPRIIASFHIERDGKGLFFKLFTGVYVAFCISILVFRMGTDNMERFGLLVGALFAAIGNKYIVDGLLPQTTAFTLVDKIHALTFGFILLHLIGTVWVWRLHSLGNFVKAKAIDKNAFWLSLTLYVILNVFFILQAL
jgi:hypothetical protein